MLTIKYNTEWFIQRMKESHPNDYKDYEVKSEYVNSHTRIKMFHKKCGLLFEITPNSFISGRGCLKCGHERATKVQMKSAQQVNNDFPKGVYLIGKYTGSLKKAHVHCRVCNKSYYIRPHDLIRRQQCPFCSGYNKETTETFRDYLKSETGNEYCLLGDYKKANEYVTIKHNLCGYTYKVTPHNFKHGRRCPKCKQSIGESLIRKILQDSDISFIPQKTFEGCKDKTYLSYDFYIPSKNILIEYQGEQHYRPVELFGGEEKFAIQKSHDKLKRDFAKEHKIKLIEVPYKVNTYKSIKKFIDSKF